MNDPLLGLENHFENIISSSLTSMKHYLQNTNLLFVIAVAEEYKNVEQIVDDLEELKYFLIEYALGIYSTIRNVYLWRWRSKT